jgi:hypothetical protein
MPCAAPPFDRAEELRTVVLYQDRACRDRALRLCDRIMQELGEGPEFQLACWKFEFLADAELARRAAADAIEADVIIFAAHPADCLSATVADWTATWINRRLGREGMLVALLDLPEDQPSGLTPMHLRLQDLARRAGMDFLPYTAPVPRNRPQAAFENILRRSQAHSAMLDGILDRAAPVRQWGLNE